MFNHIKLAILKRFFYSQNDNFTHTHRGVNTCMREDGVFLTLLQFFFFDTNNSHLHTESIYANPFFYVL